MQTIDEKLALCRPCSDDAEILLTLGELRRLRQDLENARSELRLLKAGRPDDSIKLPA
jgi:hypothetical protein